MNSGEASAICSVMTLMQTLREQTAEEHKKIEASLNLFERIHSLNGYMTFLTKHLALYSALEDGIAKRNEWLALGIDYSIRRKVPWLEKDLRMLGAEVHPVPIQGLPPLSSFEQVLGCTYVMEGSTLGGQLICRHFATRLGLSHENGLAFYTGYGKQTGLMWQEFGAAINQYAQSLDDVGRATVVQSAIATFKSFTLNLG